MGKHKGGRPKNSGQLTKEGGRRDDKGSLPLATGGEAHTIQNRMKRCHARPKAMWVTGLSQLSAVTFHSRLTGGEGRELGAEKRQKSSRLRMAHN